MGNLRGPRIRTYIERYARPTVESEPAAWTDDSVQAITYFAIQFVVSSLRERAPLIPYVYSELNKRKK